jgi:hypothetical protein
VQKTDFGELHRPGGFESFEDGEKVSAQCDRLGNAAPISEAELRTRCALPRSLLLHEAEPKAPASCCRHGATVSDELPPEKPKIGFLRRRALSNDALIASSARVPASQALSRNNATECSAPSSVPTAVILSLAEFERGEIHG